MSTPRSHRPDPPDSSNSHSGNQLYHDGGPSTPSGASNPTYAAFSPATLSSTTPSATSAAKRRSTILVHQKSPLLLATPPQITRALAYSHPFILLLNKLAGLLSWSTGDSWESFLLVITFWAIVLYGDTVIRLAGPVVLVLMLIGGMYGRRFSPLSSSGRSEPGLGSADGSSPGGGESKGTKKAARQKNLPVDSVADNPVKQGTTGAGAVGAASKSAAHQRSHSYTHAEATNTRHQKTLDEIVETLKEFTTRCNVLLEPLLELTDFLSTQRTPTSATTRPALTALFLRILLCTPFWFALTLPPLRIVTTRRVVLVFGTVVLTWHARVVRVSRTILWRSGMIRRSLALVTGLQFDVPLKPTGASNGTAPSTSTAPTHSSTPSSSSTSGKAKEAKGESRLRESELTKALRRARGGRDAGVRFTFIIYENQRRWLGLGWTNSLFAYERSAWTDEHNNAVPPRSQFELPEVEDGSSSMAWRWVEGSRWRVDGVSDEDVAGADSGAAGEWDYDSPGGAMGWVYYDSKWQNGRRGQDGWGRWTRRRKWYRDAELVERGDDDVLTTAPQEKDSAPKSSADRQAAASSSATGVPEAKEGDADEAGADLAASVPSTTGSPSRTLRSGSSSVRSATRRRRRASEQVVSEEVATAMARQLGLAARDGETPVGSWGVGDEVRMGLE